MAGDIAPRAPWSIGVGMGWVGT